ncbi:hypothetical protein ACIGZJ_15410, partial [Kitasatospora sp. NPDC052868]|uniref:hypothetical protein n=1 Tax=Kitasatospora sp. NPDC052868 TaxID=3364060 RepID=UPI0037CC9F67
MEPAPTGDKPSADTAAPKPETEHFPGPEHRLTDSAAETQRKTDQAAQDAQAKKPPTAEQAPVVPPGGDRLGGKDGTKAGDTPDAAARDRRNAHAEQRRADYEASAEGQAKAEERARQAREAQEAREAAAKEAEQRAARAEARKLLLQDLRDKSGRETVGLVSKSEPAAKPPTLVLRPGAADSSSPGRPVDAETGPFPGLGRELGGSGDAARSDVAKSVLERQAQLRAAGGPTADVPAPLKPEGAGRPEAGEESVPFPGLGRELGASGDVTRSDVAKSVLERQAQLRAAGASTADVPAPLKPEGAGRPEAGEEPVPFPGLGRELGGSGDAARSDVAKSVLEAQERRRAAGGPTADASDPLKPEGVAKTPKRSSIATFEELKRREQDAADSAAESNGAPRRDGGGVGAGTGGLSARGRSTGSETQVEPAPTDDQQPGDGPDRTPESKSFTDEGYRLTDGADEIQRKAGQAAQEAQARNRPAAEQPPAVLSGGERLGGKDGTRGAVTPDQAARERQYALADQRRAEYEASPEGRARVEERAREVREAQAAAAKIAERQAKAEAQKAAREEAWQRLVQDLRDKSGGGSGGSGNLTLREARAWVSRRAREIEAQGDGGVQTVGGRGSRMAADAAATRAWHELAAELGIRVESLHDRHLMPDASDTPLAPAVRPVPVLPLREPLAAKPAAAPAKDKGKAKAKDKAKDGSSAARDEAAQEEAWKLLLQEGRDKQVDESGESGGPEQLTLREAQAWVSHRAEEIVAQSEGTGGPGSRMSGNLAAARAWLELMAELGVPVKPSVVESSRRGARGQQLPDPQAPVGPGQGTVVTSGMPAHSEVEDSDTRWSASQAPPFLPVPPGMRQRVDSDAEEESDGWGSDSDGGGPAAPVVQAPVTQTPVIQAPAAQARPFLPMPERMRQKSDSEGEADDDWDSDSGGEGPSAPVVRTPATQTVQLPQVETLNIGGQTQPSESSSPVGEPVLLLDLPELREEPPIDGPFTADELWRDGDHLPQFILYNGAEGMVWDDRLDEVTDPDQLDRMAAVYNRAAEQVAHRLARIVERARQVVADGGDRREAAETLLATHQVLSADGWAPAYVSEFLRLQMLFRASDVPQRFPRGLAAWPSEGQFALFDPAAPPVPGTRWREGGSMVGPDGASMRFYRWLDETAGGDRRHLYNWGKAQAGASVSRDSMQAKLLFAYFRTQTGRHIGDEYFWFNGFKHRLKETHGFRREIGGEDVFGFTYDPGYLRSVAAQHVFTYEMLRTVPMPRVNRDAGTIDLIRLEQRSVLRDLLEPYRPDATGRNHQTVDIHRGPAESFSLLNPYKEVVGGDFWLTTQTVPIQRVFGTHLQIRMEDGRETSLYLGEDEFLTMVTDRQVECWGEDQPLVTEQELQAHHEALAAQQAAAEAAENENGNAGEGAAPWSESQAPPSDSDDEWDTGSAPGSPVAAQHQQTDQQVAQQAPQPAAQEAAEPVEVVPAGREFHADLLWRPEERLPDAVLFDGNTWMAWGNQPWDDPDDDQLGAAADEYGRAADEIAARLERIVAQAEQVVAQGPPVVQDGGAQPTPEEADLAAARTLLATHRLLADDGWSPEYISEFLYLQMSMRDSDVLAGFPARLVEQPPEMENGFQRGRLSLVAPGAGPGAVEGGSLRGAGGASDRFYTWLGAAPRNGEPGHVLAWGAAQAYGSWTNEPATAKLMFARSRSENLEGGYYWAPDLNEFLKKTVDRHEPDIIRYPRSLLRSLVAQHVFTYELLKAVELPNVDRQNGMVRLMRLENRLHVDPDNPDLPHPDEFQNPELVQDPAPEIPLEILRGAAESFSLLDAFKDPKAPQGDGREFYVTVQDVPIHRVFGTHLQSRFNSLDDSLFYSEDEFVVMAAGYQPLYRGTDVPLTPAQRAEAAAAALAEQLAGQGLAAAPPLVAGPVGGPVPVVEPGPVVVGAGLLPAQA